MRHIRPVAAAVLFSFASPLWAADDVAALRAELDALKAEYATKVSALETRIGQLEAASAAASAAAEQGPPPAAFQSAPAPPSGNSATAFNPAMSMILAGSYTNTSEDPNTYRIAGFIPNDGDVGPGPRSFNLGESELTVAANVDPYFFANVTASMSADNEIEVEEAFFRTLALHDGFTIKGGRFFSGLGYLNEIHAHAWDFADQPLVYQAFFGSQFTQDGIQVKWLAPTDLFIEFGAEAGNGESFPGTHRNRNGLNSTTLFAHVGGDVGDSLSWRTGLSWLDADADNRAYEDIDAFGNEVTNAFTGSSKTWIADAVLKWAPHGDTTQHQLKVQAEYMQRTEDGDLTFNSTGLGPTNDYRSKQSGWYVQILYQFKPRWRAGIRYDSLDSGTPSIGTTNANFSALASFPTLMSASPERVSVMLDFSPSEFSRLRTQYSWDEARADLHDRQFLIQYLFGIGAHGAHKF